FYVKSTFNWDHITTRFLDLYEATVDQSQISVKESVPIHPNLGTSAMLDEVVTYVKYLDKDITLTPNQTTTPTEAKTSHP
ncbi:MAG: hypothetical protein LH702_10465, partial [Phormidesmis sp. CAN_BIN44]|nr:hypothetical protein [Phormidesmis sp. CAN_BIN44]